MVRRLSAQSVKQAQELEVLGLYTPYLAHVSSYVCVTPCFLTCNTVIKGEPGSRLAGMVGEPPKRTRSPPDFINVGQWHLAPAGHKLCKHHKLTAVAAVREKGNKDRLRFGLARFQPQSQPAIKSFTSLGGSFLICKMGNKSLL